MSRGPLDARREDAAVSAHRESHIGHALVPRPLRLRRVALVALEMAQQQPLPGRQGRRRRLGRGARHRCRGRTRLLRRRLRRRDLGLRRLLLDLLLDRPGLGWRRLEVEGRRRLGLRQGHLRQHRRRHFHRRRLLGLGDHLAQLRSRWCLVGHDLRRGRQRRQFQHDRGRRRRIRHLGGGPAQRDPDRTRVQRQHEDERADPAGRFPHCSSPTRATFR